MRPPPWVQYAAEWHMRLFFFVRREVLPDYPRCTINDHGSFLVKYELAEGRRAHHTTPETMITRGFGLQCFLLFGIWKLLRHPLLLPQRWLCWESFIHLDRWRSGINVQQQSAIRRNACALSGKLRSKRLSSGLSQYSYGML